MRTVFRGLTVLGCLFLSPSPAFAGATELARGRTTQSIDQNAITADNSVRYGGYVAGERITVRLDYSATCNVVFGGLTLFRPTPFAPPGIVTGEIAKVKGTPMAGHPAKTGSVTFIIRFNTLKEAPTGTRSGLARLNLALGADKDCDLATGDSDRMDRSTTVRVQISVSSDSE
jgi:hypothetical protein